MRSLVVTCLLAACNVPEATSAPTREPDAVRISAVGYESTVLPVGSGPQVAWLGRTRAAAYFEPTPADIARFEAGLPAALEAGQRDPATIDATVLMYNHGDFVAEQIGLIREHLDEYRCQYVGLIEADGARRILARFFPGPAVEGTFEFAKWQSEIVVVSDGGFWYWQVEFDLATGRHLAFDSNGYA